MMLVGLKNLPVEFEYIQNNDVQARIDKVGVNAVPILQKQDGSYMKESLDIVAYLDQLDGQPVLEPARLQNEIAAWHQLSASSLYPLLFPRTIMVDFPEFDSGEARAWFEQNKSAMLGMKFAEAYADSATFITDLNAQLSHIDWLTLPSQRNDQLSYDDINIYPTLRNLTLIKGLVLPELVRTYIDEVSALTGIRTLDKVAV